MDAPSVYDSLDYRAWMKAWFEAKKTAHPRYSLRVMSSRMGVDGSYLHRVLHRNRHLSTPLVAGVGAACALRDDELRYFALLVSFNKASSEAEARALQGKLSELRGVKRRLLGEAEVHYWSSWRHAAVRSLLGTHGFTGGARKVAQRLRPAVTVAQAGESIELLLELGLVEKGRQGRWILRDPHLTTGSRDVAPAVRNFHGQMLDLARRTLDELPKEKRHLASLTLASDEAAVADIVEILRECRGRIQRRLSEVEKPDRVMQLGMQLFPLSTVDGEEAP
jgi:uncharacterized protein (TIGR02147 family)